MVEEIRGSKAPNSNLTPDIRAAPYGDIEIVQDIAELI